MMKVKWENMEIVTMQTGCLLLTRRRRAHSRQVNEYNYLILWK